MKFYNLTNDHLFKRIFTEEKYLNILLKTFFNVDAHNIKYLNSELVVSHKQAKVGIVDLLLEIDGSQVILELQNINEHNFDKRLLYYSSGVIYTHCLGQGDDYTYLKKIKVYAILNYALFDDSDDDGVYLTRKNQLFSENLEYKIFDLTKIDENNKKSKNYELVNLFKTTNLNKLKEIIKTKECREILEKMEIYNQEEEEYKKMDEIYEKMLNEKIDYTSIYKGGVDAGFNQGKALGISEGKALGISEGKALGIRQGIKRGEKNKTIAIAKNLLMQKVDINTIATATNLSIKEINALK